MICARKIDSVTHQDDSPITTSDLARLFENTIVADVKDHPNFMRSADQQLYYL